MSWGVTFVHHGPRSIRCSSPLLGLQLVGSIYGVTWEGVTCRRTQEGRGTLLACVQAPGGFRETLECSRPGCCCLLL